MKRLFSIGAGLFLYSIVPIASWLVLALVIGDNRVANVFSITYPLQFVWAIIKSFFGTGANIRKEKEKDENVVDNSIFWGSLVSIIIFVIPLIFVENFIAFFGQDVEFYKQYVIYSMILILLQTLFSLMIEKFYFEDKEKTANLHLLIFNLLNFCVLILLALIIKTTWIALLVTLIVLLGYVLFLYIKYFHKFKINLKIFKNFKYESANIVSHFFMFITYLFGFKNAFTAGAEYILALNLVSLCTDAQWDSLEAVSTVAKVDISKNRYEYKKQTRQAYYYSLVVMLSSFVMVMSLFSVYGAKLELVLIYFAFQLVDMLMHPYKSILKTFTQIEYSPFLSTISDLVSKVVRLIISVSLLSPFCTETGQVVGGLMLFIFYLILRFTKFKIVDNKITIKEKSIKLNE